MSDWQLIRIYFAHSKQDYGTEYEMACIEKIKSDYPYSVIINSWDIIKDVPREEMKKLTFWEIEKKYFYPEIDICSFMVTCKCWNDRAWRGRYTPGVQEEIKYAKEKGKKILEFGE
jgi:hypothetical protein